MRCRALVLAALGAGCVEVPGPAPVVCRPGDDADGDGWACDARLPDCDDDDDAIHPGADDVADDGVDQDCLGGDARASELLTGARVDDSDVTPWAETAGASLTFPFTGVRYPEEMFVDAIAGDVLDTGDGAAGMGLAIAPLFSTADVTDAPRLEVIAEGPALGIARLSWAQDDVGGAPVEATTNLWVFPDGRIVRNDIIDVSETIAGADLALSAYLALRAQEFTHLSWRGLPGGVPLDGDTPAELWVDDPWFDGWLCLYDQASGGMTGFGWSTPGEGAGPRATAGGGRVTFSWDWVRGATEIPAGSYAMATVTFAGAAGGGERCDVTPAELGFYDGDVFTPMGDAGAGEVDGSISGRFLFSMVTAEPFAEAVVSMPQDGASLHVTLAGNAEPGVAVWVDGTRLRAGIDYLRQYGDQDAGRLEVILYLPALEADQVIRVGGPGGEP